MKTSDPQQDLVYDAEHEVQFIVERGGMIDFFGSTLYIEPCERRFARAEDVVRFIKVVCDRIGVTNVPAVQVRKGLRRSAYYKPMEHGIYLPEIMPGSNGWAMRETVILHELAHALTPFSGHGPRFAGALVFLYRQCLTPECAALLERSFIDRGVQVTPYVV